MGWLKNNVVSLNKQAKMIRDIRLEMEKELKMADMSRVYGDEVEYQHQMDEAMDRAEDCKSIHIKDDMGQCQACGSWYYDKQLEVYNNRLLCGFCVANELEHQARSYTGLE